MYSIIDADHFWPVLASFIGTLIFLSFCYDFAVSINLVDRPSWRKDHKGEVPLIGGLAIIFGFSIACLLSARGLTEWRPLFVCMIPLMVVGVLDDHGDLSIIKRLIAQGITCIIMFYFGKIQISNLGDIIGFGRGVQLDGIELFITFFCVIGVINSLNLIDGIDGLCVIVSIIACASILLIMKLTNAQNSVALVFYFCISLSAFLIVNLGLAKGIVKKVFLGDAGTTIIGFFLCWHLIKYSNGSEMIFRPIFAVWIIALPIMDTISVMIRRLMRNESPFHPGKDHVHHILIDIGFSRKSSLLILSIFSIALAAIGILLEINAVPEAYMFYGILSVFILFHILLHKKTNTKIKSDI